MKKARFNRAAYDKQQLQCKQLRRQDRHSLFIGPDGELADSHSAVIKRSVIGAVLDERPGKERRKSALSRRDCAVESRYNRWCC